MKSKASFYEQYKEAKKRGNKMIDRKEFREMMIKNGFKPKVMLRSDSGSPKASPPSKVHNRLYNEKDNRERHMEKRKTMQLQEEIKECTFSPKLPTKNFKVGHRSPRPGGAKSTYLLTEPPATDPI